MTECVWRDWQIEFKSGIPVYKQIVNRVSSALAGGRLRTGDRLPTIRELHEQLEVNPNTVAKAYRELELRGLITCERGNGTYVRDGTSNALPSQEERRAAVDSFCQRLLGEAAGCGVTEEEVVKYLQERNNHERNRPKA